MAEKLYRAQIMLEKQQHEALGRLADAKGASISQLIREAVAVYLTAEKQGGGLRKQMQTLENLEELRRNVYERHGEYMDDLVSQVRQERIQQTDEVWRGE